MYFRVYWQAPLLGPLPASQLFPGSWQCPALPVCRRQVSRANDRLGQNTAASERHARLTAYGKHTSDLLLSMINPLLCQNNRFLMRLLCPALAGV